MRRKNFAWVAVLDFEYEVSPGDLPIVLCLVVYLLDEQLRYVRTIRKWRGEFGSKPPFDIGPDTLVVGYSLWEMTCFLVLGWTLPVHVFDLHTCYQACPTRRMSSVKSHAVGCPVLAGGMVSMAGSASTRK